MWRELILEVAPIAELGAPADEASLHAVAEVLGQPLPTDLAALLRECDGLSYEGLDVVWSARRIARDNAEFRNAPDFASLYMPFEPLMFFGDNASDQFAFVRTPARDEVFVWDHETDSRFMATGNLRQYLERALRERGDWYR
ncbi:SMI1/KNR4 family protein [Kitasatospora sp. NPDC059599]|uniref:SMI1/KNR4 family protein n=1 Tax=Kitasatospora sp. NPDC059599 TaxID=3346880 RepID=UPI0036BBE603